MARITEEFTMLINSAQLEEFTIPYSTKTPQTIELSKLPISKAAMNYEKNLQKYLIRFANTIMNVPQTNESMTFLASDLKDELWIHAYQIYFLGAIYVSAFAELKPRITERDRDNVQTITDMIFKSIWGRVEKFFVREKKIEDEQQAQQLSDMLKQGGSPKALKAIFNPKKHKPLNLDKQFKGLATVLSTTAINTGTIDKARQIREGIANGTIIIPGGKEKIASAAGEQDILEFGPGLFQSLNWVIWVTAEDDRVCLQCRELEGEIFLLSDPTMIIPVRDTHDNCRCRLLLIDRIFDEEVQENNLIFAA